MLSRWKVIYRGAFFIMTMYREKGIIFDYLKRSLNIRHSPIVYTSYKYIRVPFGIVEKEMLWQFHTGYRIHGILQTCLSPT